MEVLQRRERLAGKSHIQEKNSRLDLPLGKPGQSRLLFHPKDPPRGARLTPFPRNQNPFCRGKARRETHPPDP